MFFAIVLAGGFATVLLIGIFWTLRRAGSLRRHRNRIEGHYEVFIPTWINQMRRGEWDGTALPVLVAVIGLIGTVYSAFTAVLFATLTERNYIVSVVLTGGLIYLTFMLAHTYIRTTAYARSHERELTDASNRARGSERRDL